MARKGWDRLSEEYRRRLERGGITKEKYRAGAGLEKARGHTSPQREREYRRQIAAYRKWGPTDKLGRVVTEDEHGNRRYGDRFVPEYLRHMRRQFGNGEVRRLITRQVEKRLVHANGEPQEPDAIGDYRRYRGTSLRYFTWYHERAE